MLYLEMGQPADKLLGTIALNNIRVGASRFAFAFGASKASRWIEVETV